jgi:ribosomal-protein-alanine N-acetyltransferase
VAVTPEFAGRGLGTSLVRQALRWSASRGVRSMVLNVRKENVRARSLYESEGFSRAAGNLVLMRFDGAGAS